MTDCNKSREMISDYIDGMLNNQDSSAFEEHISCCEKCHQEYDMIKAMNADLSKSTASLPDGFSRRMHKALVNAQFASQSDNRDKKVIAFYSRYARFATVAAAVMVFAVVGKYGVYDVYKNVVNETNSISEQYIAVTGEDAETETKSAETAPEDVSVEIKEVKNNADVIKEVAAIKKEVPVKSEEHLKQAIPETANEQLQTAAHTPEDIVAQTESIPENAAADSDKITSLQPESHPNARIADIVLTDMGGTDTEELTEETADAFHEKTADEAGAEITSSGSGGGATSSAAHKAETDAHEIFPEADNTAETTQTAEETKEKNFVPTVVEINKSGDGSMLVFKKYLYTFLNSSEIEEDGDIITITISADEFTDVIEKISANEYVKSITVGTNVNGKAVITIK